MWISEAVNEKCHTSCYELGDNMNIPKAKKSQYNYIVKTFTYDGIRYKVRGATEEEAIKKKLKKLEELEAGRITSNSTVKQWAETWLETYVKPRGLIDASYRMYEDTMNNAILPAIGNYKMNKVTALQLQKILNTRTGMSFSHASKLRIVLKAMFRQAWLNRIIPFDVSADLQMPKTTKGKHRSLTARTAAPGLNTRKIAGCHDAGTVQKGMGYTNRACQSGKTYEDFRFFSPSVHLVWRLFL